jgi:Tol biopolymer transport system component
VTKIFAGMLPFLFMVVVSCSSGTPGYKIALVPSGSGQHGIFVMNSDTTGGRLLTPDANAQLRTSSWSPDGSKILFLSYRSQDSEIMNKYRIPSHFALYMMDAGGNNQKRLLDFPVSAFSWSPDSRKLLFVSAFEDPAKDDYDVQHGKRAPMSAAYVFDLATGTHKRITAFGQICSASWSPTGGLIAISLGSNETANIYVISLDGKVARHVTQAATMDIQPSWSPDGKTIVYLAVSPPSSDVPGAGVYVIKDDGSDNARISDIVAYDAIWSPDGKKLLILASDGIYLLAANGGKPLRLSNRSDRPLDAVFTPDGGKVMFRSNLEGNWGLHTIDLEGKNRTRISGQLEPSYFCLSPLSAK